MKIRSIHSKINASDVQAIVIHSYFTRNANTEESENIVRWFNSINNIQENPGFAGTTDNSSIEITLKSGGNIWISYPAKYNTDFEIQRNNKKGKRISYWGKQPDIRKLLEKAAAP